MGEIKQVTSRIAGFRNRLIFLAPSEDEDCGHGAQSCYFGLNISLFLRAARDLEVFRTAESRTASRLKAQATDYGK